MKRVCLKQSFILVLLSAILSLNFIIVEVWWCNQQMACGKPLCYSSQEERGHDPRPRGQSLGWHQYPSKADGVRRGSIVFSVEIWESLYTAEDYIKLNGKGILF